MPDFENDMLRIYQTTNNAELKCLAALVLAVMGVAKPTPPPVTEAFHADQ